MQSPLRQGATEQRVQVYDQVVRFLTENPKIAAEVKVIAVDGDGVVYVLDEEMSPLASVGAPSTVGM